MIFEIFNDIVAYLDIKEINHDKLKHIFGHIKYPINVKFDNERSSYNNATKNITIQAQGKSDFLHEITHKSVTEKFTHFYPYYPHNNTQHINFLIASKEILCNFSKVVQESCLDICNIKNATIEELYSNMQQIHSSLRKHVFDKICLLAIGEYGNELFDTSHYFYKKLYAIVFVTMIDLLTHKTEECKTLDGCPENISLNILFNGFTILEKMILHEKNFEAFGKFAIEASLQYDPSFDNTNKNAATKSPVLTKGREMSSITFPLVLKTLPKLSIASEKFDELWQTHLDVAA